MVVFTFLYLPIAVMVLFAFNKPSAAALEGFTGSNVCDLPPSQVGNVTVWNGFTTCWFNAGLHDPTYIPAIVDQCRRSPPRRPSCRPCSDWARRWRWRG